MATIRYEKLIPQVKGNAPGAPEEVIIQALRASSREICKETKMWEYQQPTRRLSPGVYDYEYELPEGATVNTITRVRVNDVPVVLASLDDIHAIYAPWPNFKREDRSTPVHFAQLDADNFIVAPVPDDAVVYDIAVSLTLIPSLDALSIDSEIYSRIGDAMIDYAIHRVHTIPGGSWNNTELAAFFGKEYRSKLAKLRANQNLSPVRETLTVQVPAGF